MKIIIYVKRTDLEELNAFLGNEIETHSVKYFYDFDEIIFTRCVMVTISYDDFIRVEECQR
jgi:hypothetical protein